MKIQKFIMAAAALAALFSVPLWKLCRFALGDDLFSYVVLIPFISVYLATLDKKNLPPVGQAAWKTAILFFSFGAFFLVWSWRHQPELPVNWLALTTLSFSCFLTGLGCIFLGGQLMRALAFPFAMLVFFTPFPQAMTDAIEVFLQHGSAEVADWMLTLSGMTYFRLGLQFQLPGITLQVAPECSGIHSTVVLFITSLVAGKMLLRGPWKRAILTFFVLPLALARNAFRIFVLCELCVHVGPHMIDSPIHHHGGPLFFALSLLPFFALLFYLRKTEKNLGQPSDSKS